ncbi:MAG: hypothetical protein KJ620_03790 [Candidatus Edwardsbacteria bacterium]|nr:hypothetical protein [Candidatus Edwardsbacteria bacterium]MBU1576039.1 hypothetical protein [Candidatus Edwardsbacteria bacterium]MBU2463062.1 hypothetical protein [Candidatus Edwardsbacteria bacterium]MBU2594302.1 hypothetical protein [Candidatus Edwardsbacteria bacterium]
MKRTAIYLALSIVLTAAPLFAARPLDTDDAGTVEKGKFETELSFGYCIYRPDGTGQIPGIAIKHGLTDRFDLGLGFSHSTDKDADGNSVAWGMSPLEVSFKLGLFRERPTLPDISVSAGFEKGNNGYGLNLILSREYGNLGLHYNLGYNASGEAMVKGSIATSLAAEYIFMEKYRVCGELNSEILDDRSEVLENSGLIGGSSDFGPLIWDLGLRIHDQRGPKATITTGITAGF